MSEPCTLCPLHQYATTNCMDGFGPSGGIMVVGEAPGAAEDALGQPFVGRSGQLLRSMLTDAGIDPDTVRYTNAARCRPRKNRKPTPKEIKTCREYLIREIEIHRPTQIVPVGDVALRAVLAGRGGITRARGQRESFDHRFGNSLAPEYVPGVLPTLHPAYVLRTPALYDTVVSDLKQLHHPFVDTPDNRDRPESVQFRVVDEDLEPVLRLLRSSHTFAWDVETSYWQDGGSRVIQWAGTGLDSTGTPLGTVVCGAAAVLGSLGGNRGVREQPHAASGRTGQSPHVQLTDSLPERRQDSADERSQPHVQPGFSGERVLEWVTHNGWSADIPWMAAMGYSMPRGRDTMVLGYLMDETQPLGLEPLAMRYLGVSGWKDEGHKAEPESSEFALYNARDAEYTARLYTHFKEQLGARIKIADHIISPAAEALDACTARGIRVSLRAVEEAERVYSDRAGRERFNLQCWGIDNPNSTRQLVRCLADQGITLTERTESGEVRLDKEILSSLPQEPLVQAIRSYKYAEKRRQMIVPYREALSSTDGRVHPTYTTIRTVTGRTSARGPNVQQVARDPLMRAMLPGDSCDYSAIEFRLAAWIAGETGVLERFRADPFWDPHRWFAALYYGIPEGDVTDEQRQVAKSANFGLLFKALPPTLVDYTRATTGIEMSLAEATRVRSAWLAALPGFEKWWGRTERFITRNGYAESPTGRRRHFGPPAIVRRSPHLQEFVREGVNSQVQSFAADVALLGLSGCYLSGLPITGFYHDAVSFDGDGVDRDAVYRSLLQHPREQLAEHFGIDLDIPLAVEYKKGKEKWTISYYRAPHSSSFELVEKPTS